MISTEKKWLLVTPQLFTSNGTEDGIVTIEDTSLFRVKQKVYIQSLTQPRTEDLEVKRVLSPTQMIIGETGDIKNKEDITAFLTTDAASIGAIEQGRPSIDIKEHERAVYEEEPVMAKRVILVDKYGNKIDEDNPLPTNAEFTGSLSIALDGFKTPPDNVQIVGTEDGTKTGTRHVVKIENDGAAVVRDITNLVRKRHDYSAKTSPTPTQDLVTFKVGGSGGTTVATILVNWVDSSKNDWVDYQYTEF